MNPEEFLAQKELLLTDKEIESFYLRVNKTDSCWLWLGAQTDNGYGYVEFRGIRLRVHRLSFWLNKGIVPQELKVMHSCDVRLCLFPGHLSLGTIQDNNKDRHEKGRTFRVLTPDLIERIKALYINKNQTQRSVARAFGLPKTTIRRALSQ
jgi:hypothetical protein